jgi:hypothetical protein
VSAPRRLRYQSNKARLRWVLSELARAARVLRVRLPHKAVAILTALYLRTGDLPPGHDCRTWLSQATLAREAVCCERTIRNVLPVLEWLGVLTVTNRDPWALRQCRAPEGMTLHYVVHGRSIRLPRRGAVATSGGAPVGEGEAPVLEWVDAVEPVEPVEPYPGEGEAPVLEWVDEWAWDPALWRAKYEAARARERRGISEIIQASLWFSPESVAAIDPMQGDPPGGDPSCISEKTRARAHGSESTEGGGGDPDTPGDPWAARRKVLRAQAAEVAAWEAREGSPWRTRKG